MKSVLSDVEITEEVEKNGMIRPFVNHQVRKEERKPVISYGLSSFGYDIRLGSQFKCFDSISPWIIDPKNAPADKLIEFKETNFVVIPANSFVLGLSMEYFVIPRDIIGICVGKSTYARCGILVNTTPIESGWQGYLVIEISNTAPVPVKIYPNEGIAQTLFFRGQPCQTSYEDRGGKYHRQESLQGPEI